ncbi:MAG: PKD domain-containing protein, partial [Bacteroidota bacterium]
RNPSGNVSVNHGHLTYNLSNYDTLNDVILLDFAFMEHGDETQANDSVWVRGCDTCPWIGLLDWNVVSGGNDGVWINVTSLDMTSALRSGGQNFSSSFQLRFGQEDNFPATSTIGSDGFTFDDVCLSRLLSTDAGITDILSPQPYDCADSLSMVEVIITNFGVDPLVNVPITVNITGPNTASVTDTFPGPLASGAQDTFLLGPWSNWNGGAYDFCAFSHLPTDSILSNDTTCASFEFLSVPVATPSADTICVNDSTLLSILNADSATTYVWWDSATGGSMIGTGTSFQTPPLSQTTTYYVEGVEGAKYQVGPPTNGLGTGTQYSFFTDGLRFDVDTLVSIDTVFVYPGSAGSITVNVRDSLGNLVGSETVAISLAAGKTPIPLGIIVPPGTDYRMDAVGSSASGLYRNQSGALFPYSEPNVLSITGNINNLANFYYFFYDWRISLPSCPGPRVATTVEVLTTNPVAGFSQITNGLTADFTNNSSIGIQSWQWDFGDNSGSSQANPSHTYATPGNYLACLIVTDICGQMDTICDSVKVCALPVAGFSTSNTGLQASFTDLSQNAATYFWELGDGTTATAANPMHTYLVDSMYWVCQWVTNACGETDSICDSVAVCAELNPTLTALPGGGAGLTYDFTGMSSGTPTSWSWDFGDSNTGSGPTVSHTYATDGSYTATLTVTNVCGEVDSTSITIMVVGVEAQIAQEFNVFPNPTAGAFTVRLVGLSGNFVEVMLYDVVGKKLMEVREVAGETYEKTFDMALPAGSYLLEVRTAEGRETRRVMVTSGKN